MTPVSQCPGYPRFDIFKIWNVKWESTLRVCGSLDLCSMVLARKEGSDRGCGSWESEGCMTPEVRCREAIISGTYWMNSAHTFQWLKDQGIQKGLKSVAIVCLLNKTPPCWNLHIHSQLYICLSKFSLLKQKEHAEGFSDFRKGWCLDGVTAGYAYQYSFPLVTFCNAVNIHKLFIFEK